MFMGRQGGIPCVTSVYPMDSREVYRWGVTAYHSFCCKQKLSLSFLFKLA